MRALLLLVALLSACTASRAGVTNSAQPTHVTQMAPLAASHLVVGDIDEEGVSAGKAFFKRARGPVAVTFRSFGGSVYDGLELLRAMEEFPYAITCRIEVAMSMGAVLTSACTYRMGIPRTIMMMHGPSGGARGKSGDLSTAGDHLRVVSLALGRQFCGRLKMPMEVCLSKFDGHREWFFDAEEALAVGAIDYIAK